MKYLNLLILLAVFPLITKAQTPCNLSNYGSIPKISATSYPYFSAGSGVTVNANAPGVSTLSDVSYSCNGQSYPTSNPAWWLNSATQTITLSFNTAVSSISVIFNGVNSCEEFYFGSNCGTVSLSNFCTSGYSLINGGTGLSYNGASTSGSMVTISVSGGATVFTLTHNGCGSGSRIALMDCIVPATGGGSTVIDSIADITVCNGDVVPSSNYTSTPAGATFAWNNSNTSIGLAASGTGNTPAFTATNTTTAPIVSTITVSSPSGGCSGAPTPVTYTITVNPSPTVNPITNITVCNGDVVPASNYTSTPAGATFAWTNSNTAIGLAASGSSNTPAFTATNTTGSAITATVAVTPTLNDCVGTPVSYIITVNPTPATPTAADVTICTNNTATLTATAPGGNYEWYNAANGGTLLGTGTNLTTPILTTTTTYYIQTTINGCSSSRDSVTVFVLQSLIADAGIDTTVCIEDSLFLGGNPTGFGGNGGPYTYTWSPTTGLSNPTDPNPIYTPSGLGTVTFTVQVDDGSGCPPGFAAINVTTVSCCPAVIASTSIGVASCSSVCDGSVTINVVDSATLYSIDGINWTPNNTFNNLCAGNYTVYSTDGNCSDSVNITISANPPLPTPTVVGPDTICSNDILTLTANSSANGLISWYADANGTILIDTGNVLNYSPSNSSGYITIYFSESSGNCESILGSFTVFIYHINAVINATPTSGIHPLEVTFGNNSVGANYYFWSFGDGDTSTTFSPTHIYYNEGSYQAMLVATNGVCFDTAYITIEVSSVSSIFIPNVFTPNSDGSNDFFVVKSINLKSIKGQILNRWGQTIFEWDDFNSHWNGKSSSGSLAPDGTYFYIINAEGNDGEIYLKKGSLSLIR